MKQYIGTKNIQAAPAIRYLMKDGSNAVVEKDDHLAISAIDWDQVVGWEDAYIVVYSNGDSTWCPKGVFDEVYRPTDGMSFGLAIEASKKGKRIARKGWNGKKQYVELATRISYLNSNSEVVNVEHDAIGNAAFAFVGTAGVQLGWLASQADMLAEDWYIVE